MRTILMSISLGRYCRILTLSGVGDLLLKRPDTRLVILSPAAHLQAFRDRIGLRGDVVFEDLPDYSPAATRLQRALRRLLTATWRHKGIFLPCMRVYESVQAMQEPRLFDGIFRRYEPSVVVTASPGFNSPREIPLIGEARRAGIPTLYVAYGWDSLTVPVKGFMPARPAALAVWNRFMKQEAVECHHYDPGAVKIVGPPHFDIYQDKTIIVPRERFFDRMGLDPEKKVILFATGTLRWSDNAFILDILEKAIQNRDLIYPCQVICRMHPFGKGKDRNVYERFMGSPHVKFDSNFGHIEHLGWTPDRDDVVHIANLVYHSDVVVNIASTIVLEAALLDRPVVSVGFNPVEPEKFESMVIKRVFWQHYRYVLEREACSFVENEEQFIRALNDNLSNPALRRDGRRTLVEDICYRLDGQASARVADAILELSEPR